MRSLQLRVKGVEISSARLDDEWDPNEDSMFVTIEVFREKCPDKVVMTLREKVIFPPQMTKRPSVERAVHDSLRQIQEVLEDLAKFANRLASISTGIRSNDTDTMGPYRRPQ